MKIEKRSLAISLVVLALLMSVHVAITFGIEKENKQDAVEVPALIESKKLCDGCLQEPLKKLAERPAVKKVSGLARKFRAKRKPVRSLLRRLFSR
ncbi:MAG: hypothetical protein CL524_05835 [Aequorivita sp.]|nr:hypothetical protein [Aequorivita sp.]